MFDNLINGVRKAIAAAVLAAAAADIFGATFGSGSSKSFTGLLGGIDATFMANGGNFETKSVRGWTGVGVSGKTGGEIDIGESIVGTFSTAVYVPYLTLAFLFDGPEFGDVQEKAAISAVLADGRTITHTLTALFRGDYDYSGPSFVDNLSRPTRNHAGVWDIEDPFDGMSITEIRFSALPGLCGRGSCTNQSDFAFYALGIERSGGSSETLLPPDTMPEEPGQIVATPEPGTVALLLAGMAMLSVLVRRRTTLVV